MWGGLTSGAAEDNNVCRNPYQREKEANVNLFDLSGEIAVVIGGTGVLGGAITAMRENHKGSIIDIASVSGHLLPIFA